MSKSRQSPIPQDRVNENVDEAQRAKDAQREFAERERHLKDQGVDERPGTPKADVEPEFPDEPADPEDR